MANFCPHCGNKVPDSEMRFCMSCIQNFERRRQQLLKDIGKSNTPAERRQRWEELNMLNVLQENKYRRDKRIRIQKNQIGKINLDGLTAEEIDENESYYEEIDDMVQDIADEDLRDKLQEKHYEDLQEKHNELKQRLERQIKEDLDYEQFIQELDSDI